MPKFAFLLDTQKPWHHLTVAEVLAAVESAAEGLSYVNARQRLRKLGANKLPRSRPFGKILLQPWRNPATYLLIGTAVFLQLNRLEGWALAVTGGLHGVMGMAIAAWSVKTRAKNNRDRHQNRQQDPANSAKVLRDHDAMELPTRDLVIGDILILEIGDRPNVDVRVIETSEDLLVNQTSLDGEALCPKFADLTFDEATPFLERGNMIYAGTEIVAGSAKGVVIATGRATQSQVNIIKEKPLSGIHQELHRLRQIWLGFVIVAIALIVGMGWQRGIITNGMIVAALVISTYPQHLLRLATQVQLLGMLNLAKQRLWTRFPSVLDAIARVTTIVPIIESDVVLSFDNLSAAGIAWRGLIRASEDDAQAFGRAIGMDIHSYFEAPQERIRQWQGEHRNSLESVAVIGNEIEDIPLLRMADVGISDRTCRKELQDSSGLILPKEDFHYLPIAIAEGRAVFDRLQRMVMLIASSSLALILLTLIDTAAGFTLSPLQLIWIGAIAMPIMAILIALEPTHQDLLSQPVHRFQRIHRLSNWLRILAITATAIITVMLVFSLKYQGQATLFSQARSMAFVTLGFTQIFQTLAIARHQILQHLPMLFSLIFFALCQVLFVQMPWFGDVMDTIPLSTTEWTIAILAATTTFWVQEIIKTN